jgi:hypothetical protein
MPDLTNASVTSNGLNMLDEIRRERTIELAFEGFRRDDLRRWKIAEAVMPQAIRGVKFVGTEYQDKYPDLQVGTDIQVDANGFYYCRARVFTPVLRQTLFRSYSVTTNTIIKRHIRAKHWLVNYNCIYYRYGYSKKFRLHVLKTERNEKTNYYRLP